MTVISLKCTININNDSGRNCINICIFGKKVHDKRYITHQK